MHWPAVARKLSKAAPTIVVAVALGLVVAGAGTAAGQSSLTAIDTAYTQDFDTLASSGQSDVLPTGWALAEAGSSANNDGRYTAGTGSSNAGDTYSFGTSGSPERAFGSLLSGTLIPLIGAAFTNDTGQTISSLDIGYTGEQWRLGQSDRGADRLDFEYNLTATSLTTASGWVDVNVLDFSSPVTVGTVGARDGNAAGNRTAVAGTIDGLSIAPGQTFWIRWADFNVTGADDGLAVDDFSLTPHSTHTISVADATITEGDSGTTTAGFAVSLANPAPAGGVTFDIATTDGSAQSPDDYTAVSVTGATIPEGGSTYTFDVAVNGDTAVEPDETFSVDISNVTGVDPGDTHALGTILNDDLPPPVPIHDIQGATHISPYAGQRPRVLGVVTAKSTNGFWMQDPSPDSDAATSEGIFVFTSSAPAVTVGDSVRTQGTVQEFRPGGSSSGNLTTTELSGAPSVTVLSAGNPLPPPVVIGTGGRIPPDSVIEDDAFGDVEAGGVFDPDQDGLDFYETLEGMRVQLDNAVAVGPTDTSFGETPVIGNDGGNASLRTFRGGLLLRPDDGNPERVTLDNLLTTLPNLNVGDHYSASIVGIMDYNFGNPFIEVTTPGLSAIHDGVSRETTGPPAPGELAVSTFNFENLAPTNPQSKFDSLASLIVNNLRSPDLIAGEEVQDNNGATDNGVVDASQTLSRLVAAIQAAGGPTYEWRQIDPVNDQDGGEPGGNIRQVFLFRSDRGLSFVDRPGGDSTTPNAVTGSGASTQLLYSPGRIAPGDAAWSSSRKPLAAEFSYRGHKLFAIVNHFNSKGGDNPLRGRFQPPTRSSEVQRHQQAHLVADFVSDISAADPDAGVVVLGDLNDFEFSETVGILEAAGLHDLMDTLPLNQRYSYDFEGNSQVLDHILLSGPLFARPLAFAPVHVNAEFFDQASDHDPSVVRVFLNDPPSASAGGPYSVDESSTTTLAATGTDPEAGALSYAWDLDGNGTFETPGQSTSFSADDGPASPVVRVRVTDDAGLTSTDQVAVSVLNVPPTGSFNAPATSFAGFPFFLSLSSVQDPSAADTVAGFSYAFDCGSGYGAFGSTASVSCPTTDTGTRSVGAKVRDKDGGISEYRGSVQVIVTFDSLCSLVRSYARHPEDAGELCALLDEAEATGNPGARANILRAFRNAVDAKTGPQPDKSFTQAQANELKLLSTRLT
jgi:predicted extracellular nuclease